MIKKQDDLKKIASLEALKYIQKNSIIGVGSGSTIKHFINSLLTVKNKIIGAVSTSFHTTNMLKNIGIKIFNLNKINNLSIYIDSADEINDDMQMIKGGGAALTNEKIVAEYSKKFICIVDESKKVKKLGHFPLPIEVIPIAKNLVKRKIIKIGGHPRKRKDIITENKNIIIDIYNLNIPDPLKLEKYINSIPGVVTVGIFAIRKADIAIVATQKGIKILKK